MKRKEQNGSKALLPVRFQSLEKAWEEASSMVPTAPTKFPAALSLSTSYRWARSGPAQQAAPIHRQVI